jgi:hypothetical protein
MIPIGLRVFTGPRTQVVLRPDESVGFNFVIPGVKPAEYLEGVACCMCRITADDYIRIVGNYVHSDKSYCPVLQCRGSHGKSTPDGDHVWRLPGQPRIITVTRPDSKTPFPF